MDTAKAVEDIRRVLALYCHAIDERDRAGYVGLFSRETRLYSARKIREGQAGIWDHINEVYARWPAGLITKHMLGASDIQVHGDTADAVSDVVVFQCLGESPWVIRQTGRYIDHFIIEDGEWKFGERRIESDTFVLTKP